MILATHAIVGAAAGRLFDNPWLSFAAGYVSHLAIDAIPHSQYKLTSHTRDKANPLSEDMIIDRRFVGDIIKIAIDCVGGFLLAFLIFRGGLNLNTGNISLLSGAAGGVFPDLLQFIYFKIRREPFTALQKLHNKVHTKLELHGFVGIASQVAVIALAVIVSKLIR